MRHAADADEPPVRGYAVTHPGGGAVLPQSAGWDQLIYASSGVMTVHAGDGTEFDGARSARAGPGASVASASLVAPVAALPALLSPADAGGGTWVIPPDRAVWVPATVPHRIEMSGRTAVRTLYFRTGLVPFRPRCRAVSVGPLLRELIAHAVPRCPLHLAEPREQRLIGVIIDQLAEAPTAPLRLPRPTDPRAREAALVLLSHATARIPDIEGVSRRHLERTFRADTGLSLGQYRERARLLAALPRLAAGEPVARVATDLGYATPSAFGAMFKRVLGVSPTSYFNAR